MSPPERGLFIVFEGGEGSGKTTQAALLADVLDAEVTHEPGATPLGAALRRLLLDGAAGEVGPRAEALLMAADRAQHVAEWIRPRLEAGTHVVCDRYIGSSVAYQGHGRELGAGTVAGISRWAVDGLDADLVVLLDVPPDVALQRTGAPRDRIEAAGEDFHRRVREGFLAQAAAEPERWAVVDAAGTVDDVHRDIVGIVRERLGAAAP